MAVADLDLNSVLELERKIWEALRAGDAAEDARWLSEDFVGVYPSGYADRSEHAGQLANGPTVAEYQLQEPRMIVLSHDAVMLIYRADWHPVRAGVPGAAETMYVSSLWCRRPGGWRNVFSQDSPAEAAPAA